MMTEFCRAPCPGPPSALACLVVQGVMAGLRVGLSYSSMAFLPIGKHLLQPENKKFSQQKTKLVFKRKISRRKYLLPR